MEVVVVLLFLLPAAIIVVAMALRARGASRPSVNLRKLGLVFLPVAGCLTSVLGVGLLGWALLAAINSGHRGNGGGYRRYRANPRRRGARYVDYHGGRPVSGKDVRRLQLAGDVSLKCTNGWRPVYGQVRQVQSFTAPEQVVRSVNFRAARTLALPYGELKVQIRDPRRGAVLGTWRLKDFNYGKNAVTRFLRGYTARFTPMKLRRGRKYELVFSSPGSDKNAPWLVNCFYRNTYDGGAPHTEEGGAKRDRAYCELAFQVAGASNDPLVSSIPEGADMGRKEHFGLSYGELVKRLKPATVVPPATGTNPDAPATPLPPPRPKLTRSQALAKAAKLGKVGGPQVDPVDSRLTWVPLEKKFLVVYDARDGSLTQFGEFLRLTGRDGVTVNSLAFGRDRVWAGTTRGAFVYDRRTRAWSQLAVNLDAKLLEADVSKVQLHDNSVFFTLKSGKKYALDVKTNTWRQTN